MLTCADVCWVGIPEEVRRIPGPLGMPMPSLALLLHIPNLSLRLEPYACLHLSHAGIEKMAARATQALCAAERRKLLQQMFMLPVTASVDQVELFVAQVEEEGAEGGAAAGGGGGGGHGGGGGGAARQAGGRGRGGGGV
jgi:hypothetical protein